MATFLHGESRRMYSWWWDSHISPKNSKWLQENLMDMDRNVKAMIKLIEEDADSFARRAEMYYKKRPELLKLVEEFYRAYRALAERYDHATGALRQAHQTMAEAFPNQIPSILPDESPSTSSGTEIGPHTPEMTSPTHALLDPDDLHKDALGVSSYFHAISRYGAYSEENDALSSKKGLKQLNELFPTGEGAARAKFSEGKVRKGFIFQEEEGKVKEKDDLKNEIKRLQEEVSQLSTGNENLKSQMASESERAQNLEDTLSKLESEKEVALLQYKLSIERISSLETEISNTRGELSKVNDEMAVKLNSAEERLLVMEMVNQSLQLELETQQKELEKRGRELEELNISIQEEHQKRMQAEVALMSMEQIHSHSQEEAELLALEIQNGAQKLKDMEMSKMGLEEECSKLKEIIGSLNEQNLSVDLKIKDLEDGMISLKESKGRLEDELGLHLEEKKTLQQELYCLKEDRNGLEQKHRGLMEQMEVVSEKNEDLENSLSDANVELEGLREKVKALEASCETLLGGNALEASCETLLGEVSTHVAEKGVLVSQIETISQNMEKLSEKCTLLENSLSDANDELEGLRVKFKYLEESCRSLCDQNSSLLAEKNTLVSQVENLESRYLELQVKNSNLEREKDSTVHQVMELESSLRLQKQEYEALILSSKSQLSALQNQIHLLQEEIQVKEEEFEVEQQKAMNSLLQIFILQRCLCDMKDKNLILSGECQNILEASRCAEKLISQLEHKDLIQKKEMTLLSEHNGNLREGILLLLKTLNINKECGTMDGTKDEVLLQIIFVEIKNLLSSISDAQDENRRLHLEVLVLVTLLKQTALDKSHLYRELECQTEESLALVSKKHELMEMNEQLKAEKNTLISQMEIIRQSLVNLETKYLELEDKHSSLERESDSKLHQVMELESSLRREKKEHEALILSSKSQLSSLENQIHVLQAERQVKEEEFEMEQQKAMNALLEIFILQRCLYDMKDLNLILSGECQKLLGASRCLEKLISQLEHKDLIQKKERSLLSEHNEKLREGILLLLKELNINKECGTIDGTKDEALLHAILGEIKNLLNSISDAQDENQCLHLEVLVLVTLLKEFGLDKFHLYCELESRTEEAFVLESNKHELMEMNERLKAGKTTLISEVEIIRQSLEILETKYLELEEKHSNLERERDSALRQVMELESSSRLEKQEHEAMFLSNKSQLAALENQIHLLLEERQVKEGEFEVYQQKAMNALLEIFVLQRCLYDMKDKNLILSAECLKLLDASRSLEKLMFQLKHEDLLQKKEMTLLSGRNEKLREGILLLLKELNISKECGTIDVTKDEALLQTILGDIKILLNSISDTQDENQCLHLGKSVLVTLLKQIGLEKVHFYHELESHAEEALALQSKKDEVMEMNKHLKAEMKVLCEQLSDLHGAHQRSQTEICNLLEENRSLSKKIYDLREKKGALEEENSEILAEAMTLDHLYIFFRCLSAERAIELKLLSDDIYFLLAVKNDIDKDIRVQNERMRKLEAETMHLKDSVLLLEFDLNMAQNFCEEFDLQNKTGEYLLIQKEMELSKAQDKNAELCRKLEGVNKDLDGAEVVREELEKKMLTLSEDNASKDKEITRVREANGLLCKELDRLSCEVEVLRRREEYLTSELQKGINDIYQCEGEIGTLLNDIQTSTVNAAVFEEKVFELIVACESLEICAMLQREMLTEKIVLRDACVDELKKKLDDLEGENRAVKADLNAYLPHLIALWDGIASVEEHTLSLARLQQIKDDDSLVSHQNKKSSLQQSEDDCSTEKTGLLQLQKLITKVEALRKVIIDTKAVLEQERLDSNANLEAARKEIEELKLKEISLQEISRDCGQKMKDIQLDQVSSTCIASYRPNKIENSEPSDQMLELWETAERDDIEAVEEEKSEYPSSKLVAEKEPSVDKLEVLTKVNDSPQECNKRVIERLASDAQRLSFLQRSLQELKTKLESSEKNKYPKSIEYNTFKVQLREVEEAILGQVDINGNLRKKAEDNFESSNGVIGENERRQISERSRRGSEKIGKLELEIQKIEYIFLKLEEENKRSGYGDRKSSILLRDYLYGRRDGKGRRKGSFCGCLRPKTMG